MLWRATSDVVAVTTRLQHRGMQVDTTCPLCRASPETLIHMLRDCPFARKVWSISPLLSVIAHDIAITFQDWFYGLNQTFTEEDLGLFTVLCWNICYVRNGLVWHQETPSEGQLVWKTVTYFAHYKNLKQKQSRQSSSTNQTWTCPPPAWTKLNLATKLLHTENKTSFGFVHRDSIGTVLSSFSTRGEIL